MKRPLGVWFGLGLLTSRLALGASPEAAPADTDFNRDIRPLFARHCTACHGGVKAAGRISFVYRDKALAEGKSGHRAIVPGKPGESELIRRITTRDPDDIMPRPDHGAPLSDSEVATLRRWIEQGAQWSEHWSFVPPSPKPTPTVANARWPKTAADAFILARLEAENLKPSPEATPAEWLRRVSLDLTGLPPAPVDFTDFERARRRDPRHAREQVVDRLLASPRFGERWASVWLDLARYSDTYGFEKDPHRDIWPWRDWVIRSFNADLPFDAFTIRQLAGDLLEKPSADDLLATAFHRNTQNNTEGGTDDEEYRTAAVLDRVNTTWTAWQATTFGCAQCHAHPYDPVPQRDYYRFAAFFNNTEDCDQNDDFPRLPVPQDESQREEAAHLHRGLRRQRESINAEGLAATSKVTDWKPFVPGSAQASGGTLTVGESGRIDASGTLPVKVRYTLTAPASRGLTALRIQIFPESADPKAAPERGQIFSKLSAALVVPGASNQPVRFREVVVDHLGGPYEAAEVIRSGGGFGSYPVMSGPRHGFVLLEQPLDAPDGASLELTFEHGIASNSGFQGCPLKHFAISQSSDPSLTVFAAAPPRLAAWKAWESARDRLKELKGTPVPVLIERPENATRPTRVFVRGNRTVLDELVQPGIPDVARPPDGNSTAPLTRLDLANWLVGPQNPLAARVLANRLWAEMMGHGIVETLEDFGTSGARPTHPELLDHLALRLRDDLKWSVKRFLRELALSATYAQSARATPALLDRDPANRLYARGPRTRLTAEMVRDQALALSGLLVPKPFGPPVYPPQPDGVWSTVYNGEDWKTSKGDDRFRRGVYTYSKRTSGYPLFLTFDAPTRDACTARRLPSNTPLQALTVLNDPAFMEMAQALGERMDAAGKSPRQRIEHGCRLLTLSRPPRAMVDRLSRLYEEALAEYRTDPESASKLGTTPERAALTLVANTLLNLDSSLIR